MLRPCASKRRVAVDVIARARILLAQFWQRRLVRSSRPQDSRSTAVMLCTAHAPPSAWLACVCTTPLRTQNTLASDYGPRRFCSSIDGGRAS